MDALDNFLTFLATQPVGFLLGFASSFLASIAYGWWTTRNRRKVFGSLSGVWIEANDLLEDRPFAVCEFFFSPSTGKLTFEGHSYDNTGHEYYKWWSIVLHIDDEERRLSYIYETELVRETTRNSGFGCIFLHFDPVTGLWFAQRGYFLDLDEAKPRFSRMLRFEFVAASLKRDLKGGSKVDRQILVRELIKQKETAALRQLFGWPSRNKQLSDSAGAEQNK